MKETNKIKYRLSLLIMILLVSNLFGYSQSPEKLNYQAAIRDGSGNIKANESVIIEIAILQGSVAGTEVFTEAHSVTTNDFGLVNLEIGSVMTASFSSINWSTGPYYIQLTVDGMLMGISQLLSVPYALYASEARNAENAESIDWENIEDKPNTLSGLGIDDPYNITVKSVTCHTLASANSSYQKIGDLGDFTKLNDASTIEITFNGRIGVDDITTALAIIFELRVDDEPSNVGIARAAVRREEEGLQGIRAPIFGFFTDLSEGEHTVSLWAEISGSTGSGTNVRVSPNCFSSTNMIIIKELK